MTIKNTNLLGFINYDYDTDNNCENYGCNDEGICRCSTISNCRVTGISHLYKIGSLYHNYYPCNITNYCVDRILKCNLAWDSSLYEFVTEHDYYGDILSSVTLNEFVSGVIDEEVEELLKLYTVNEKIEYILKLEYRKLLPTLANRDWKIKEIGTDLLFYTSSKHLQEAKKNAIVTNHLLPKAIVIPYKGLYQVIDGYHRTVNYEGREISVIVGE